MAKRDCRPAPGKKKPDGSFKGDATSLLVDAVQMGHANTVKILLEQGADCETREQVPIFLVTMVQPLYSEQQNPVTITLSIYYCAMESMSTPWTDPIERLYLLPLSMGTP